jgi:hypothetical protein
MSVPDADIPPHWQYYSDRACEAHEGRSDDFGSGREEQLDETLRFIETGEPFTDDKRAALDRLPFNRSKKYARLRSYVFGHAVLSYREDLDPIIGYAHESLAPGEWEIECRLADGESYAAVAAENSVGAIKMRVSRWRMRIREAHAN